MAASANHILPFIALLPLLGAVINGLVGWRLPRRWVHLIGVGSVATAFLLAVRAVFALTAVADAFPYDPHLANTVYSWAVTGIFQFDVAYYLDPLSAVMVLVVTGVGLLIHIYSIGYMADEPSIARYFAYLNLFMFSMLTLILGKNLFMLFVGWEGVGLCSYLLIGFWFSDDAKAQAGQKAFIVNRIGDVGFLIGMILVLFHTGGTTDYDALKWAFEGGTWGPFNDPMTLTVACVLLFVGAAGKSAQIPLYVWLPDAMAGPTPVSALIHAATMVTAGVYMIARLSFMFTLSTTAMGIIAVVGCLTALAAALMALTQRDIKGVLAYSTVSQLGYMVMAVGVGAFVAGVWHLMTHAFFKALLFLAAGSVIRGLHHEQDIMKMGGLRPKMRITAITFLIATLSISGFPYLSGFYSKDEILFETLRNHQLVPVPAQARAAASDGEHAYVGGRAGSLVVGAGEDWEPIQLPTATMRRNGRRQAALPAIRDIAINTDRVGFAVGEFGAIFRTDNGEDWELAWQLKDGRHLNAAYIASAGDAWFVGDRGAIVHWDGSSFKPLDSGTIASLHGVAGVGDTVYAAGAGGVILSWSGTQWAPMTSTGTAPITDLITHDGTVFGTTGGGSLIALKLGQWVKLPVTVTGVASIRSLAAVTSAGQHLALAGMANMVGEAGVRPVLLRQEAEGWTVAAGEAGAVVRSLTAVGETLYAGTDKGGMLESEGDTIRAVASVPYKPFFHIILYILATFTAGLTAFYMFRLYFLTFEGPTRCDPETWQHCHESPWVMTVPLMILAFLSFFGGALTTGLGKWLEPSLRIANTRIEEAHHHDMMAWFPTLFAAAGLFVAWAWYFRGSDTPKRLAERFPALFKLSNNKFYVDEIYDYLIIKNYRRVAKTFHKVGDVMLIDGLVNLTGRIVGAGGRAIRGLQTGDVQQYAVAIVVGLAGLIWLMGL